MHPLLWFFYRRLRYTTFTAIGRNPLSSGVKGVPIHIEMRSARFLGDQKKHPPKALRVDDQGYTLWSTSSGEFWAPPGADEKYMRLIETEARADVYCLEESRIAGSVFLDCGANIGMISRRALNAGADKVVCFEPSPFTAECLRRNLASEIAQGRAVVFEKALWDKEDKLYLNTGRIANPASHSLAEARVCGESAQDENGVWVPVTTIDHVVAELGLPRVDFIKMDIEGAEVKAIAGAKATITRFKPRIALGTEHTADIYRNNVEVIQVITATDSSYQYMSTEVHPYKSPSKGLLLVPHSLFFYPTQH